jgi:parvulin-like peptidyl-prolyl isomerase
MGRMDSATGLRAGSLVGMVLALPPPAVGQALQPPAGELPADVVARRGGVELTLEDVDTKIRSLPPDLQAGYLVEPDRIAKLVDAMLLVKQVAAEAEREGLHNDPQVIADLKLGREELLANRQVQRRTEQARAPDFSLLAQERYLSNPEAYAPPPRIDIRHVLLPTDGRDEKVAQAAAQRLRERVDGGEDFQAVVDEVVADPDNRASTDLIRHVDAGKLDPQFAASLSGLEVVGDVVGPVRSRFGYHVIRLELFEKAPTPPFEEVRERIEAELRDAHLVRERTRYLARMSAEQAELNDALILTLPTRFARQPAAAPAIDPPQAPAGR